MNTQTHSRRWIGILAAGLCLLALGIGWWMLWKGVGDRMSQAQLTAAMEHCIVADCEYTACSADTVACYLESVPPFSADACGDCLGTVTFATIEDVPVGTAYRLSALTAAGKADGIVLVEANGQWTPYELTGFVALQDSPSITAVCDAYGIASADDLSAVTVKDADGTTIDTLTAPADLSGFYQKLIALGDDLTAAQQSQAYYDAYVAEYGASDAITLTDDRVETADDETYEKACAFWGDGMCQVDITLQNGLRLCNLVYAPVPALFSVYGTYRLTEPFFS